MQVVFVYRTEDEVDVQSLDLDAIEQLIKQSLVFVYVIHAMQLTPKMLRQFRRVERR